MSLTNHLRPAKQPLQRMAALGKAAKAAGAANPSIRPGRGTTPPAQTSLASRIAERLTGTAGRVAASIRNACPNATANPEAGPAAKSQGKFKAKAGAGKTSAAVSTRIKISEALSEAAKTLKDATPGEARKRGKAEIEQIRQIFNDYARDDGSEESVSAPIAVRKAGDPMQLLAGASLTETAMPGELSATTKATEAALATEAADAALHQLMGELLADDDGPKAHDNAPSQKAGPETTDLSNEEKAKLRRGPRPQLMLRPNFAPKTPGATPPASPDNQGS